MRAAQLLRYQGSRCANDARVQLWKPLICWVFRSGTCCADGDKSSEAPTGVGVYHGGLGAVVLG